MNSHFLVVAATEKCSNWWLPTFFSHVGLCLCYQQYKPGKITSGKTNNHTEKGKYIVVTQLLSSYVITEKFKEASKLLSKQWPLNSKSTFNCVSYHMLSQGFDCYKQWLGKCAVNAWVGWAKQRDRRQQTTDDDTCTCERVRGRPEFFTWWEMYLTR